MIRKYILEKWQGDFVKSEVRFPAMVSAWGTGKSLSLILRAIHACEKFADNFGLILRRELTDLKKSTMMDFESYTGIQIPDSKTVTFPNKSNLIFMHLEELKGRNLNTMNLGFFGIEQGEELESDEVFQKLRGRLRRCHGCEKIIVDGVAQCVCKHWGAVIANTNGHDWIYNLWKSGSLKNSELFEATSFDNAHNLPVSTVEDWRELEKEKPKIFRRFVMNSWDETDAVDVVIDPEWVRKCVGRKWSPDYAVKRIVSVDVARYGDDKTVMYVIENNRCIFREEYEKMDTMGVTGRAMLLAAKFNTEWFAVDEIGIGAGVVDRMRELGKSVVAVNSSERANEPEKYYNRRAEIYAYGAERFQEGMVSVLVEDKELIEQLSWAKYKVIKSNGQVQIESKDEIKKRYGRSPDNADAFLNGLWALNWAKEGEARRGKFYIPEKWRVA